MWLIDKLTKASESTFEALNKHEFELLGDAPGPTPTAPLGNAGDFIGKNAWEVIAGYEREYGGFVRIWILGDPTIIPLDGDLTERVFITAREDFYKDAPTAALRPVLSDVEPFLANIPEHAPLQARSLFKLDGYLAWLAQQVGPLREATRVRLALLAEGKPRPDGLYETRRVGFDCFSKMAVGHTFDDDVYKTMWRMVEEGDQRMNSTLPTGQTSWDPGFLKARKSFWAEFTAAIDGARGTDLSGRLDMLALALREHAELTMPELAASLANLYFSGMLSSSSALQNTLWYLTNHAVDQEQVQAEVDGLDGDFTFEQLDALPHLDACVREALRLLPPVPIFLRQTAKDREIEIGGWSVPKDTQVFLCNYAVHRSVRNWAEPDSWKPSRWTPGVKDANPYGSGTFWPFGRGVRACTGERTAIVYIKTAIAEALREFDVSVGAGQEFVPEQFFGCMSGTDWVVDVKKR